MNRIIAFLSALLFVTTLCCKANTEQNLNYQQLIDQTRYSEALKILEADTLRSCSADDECERELGIQLCYLLMEHIKFDEDSTLRLLSRCDAYSYIYKKCVYQMAETYNAVREYKNVQHIIERVINRAEFSQDSVYAANILRLLSKSYSKQGDIQNALKYGEQSFYYENDKNFLYESYANEVADLYRKLNDTCGLNDFTQYCASINIQIRDSLNFSSKWIFSPYWNGGSLDLSFWKTHRDTMMYLASLDDITDKYKLQLLHQVEMMDSQSTSRWKRNVLEPTLRIAAIYRKESDWEKEYECLLRAYNNISNKKEQTWYDYERLWYLLIQNRLAIGEVNDAYEYYQSLCSYYYELHGLSLENTLSVANMQRIPLALCRGNIFWTYTDRKSAFCKHIMNMIEYGRELSYIYYTMNDYDKVLITYGKIDSLKDLYLRYGTKKIPIKSIKYDFNEPLFKGKCYYSKGMSKESSYYMERSLDVIKSHYWDVTMSVDSTLLGYTIYSYRDRGLCIQRYESTFNEIYRYTDLNAKWMGIVGYNQALFSKQLQLETENAIMRLVIERGIDLHRIDSLKKQMDTISSVFSKSILRQEIEKEERKIYQIIQPYTDSHEYSMYCEYDDVRKCLQKDECAIEFVHYVDTASVDNYIALIVSVKNKNPQVVHLFRDAEEKTILRDNSFVPICEESDAERYQQMIWKKLLPFIRGKKTIYFSPTGLLHNLPLESLPYDSTTIMSDHFNMVRLSSTREIVVHKDNFYSNKYGEKATIYGGIQYDVDTAEMLAESRNYAPNPMLAMRGMQNDTTNRGTVKYLAGTKKEADIIAKLLSRRKVSTTLYTSVSANEESFKSLSGKHQNIIHIGTHGFCWTDSEAQRKDYFKQQKSQSDAERYTIEPLNRCGLLFAGANLALSGHSNALPAGVEDGILTAKEISLMDLRDCELVVLSACETAKGDITSEGVFGLQRAFKMAGAQTIIMSLWAVNDNATQMLMTEFYTNWVEKKQSKREAFRNAQNAVRYAVDKDGDRMYANPVYWAGFIMLD